MTSGTAERIATFSLALLARRLRDARFVLGRSFCGWACPFNGLQQLWESVSVRPLKRVRFLPVVKYALWGAWVAAVFGIAIATGGWTRFDPLYMTENGVSVTEAGNLITYFMLVGLTLAPAALGRRGFCRYLCPFGVWGIVAEKIGHAAARSAPRAARRLGEVHRVRHVHEGMPDAASRHRDGGRRADAHHRVLHVRDVRRRLPERGDPAGVRPREVEARRSEVRGFERLNRHDPLESETIAETTVCVRHSGGVSGIGQKAFSHARTTSA